MKKTNSFSRSIIHIFLISFCSLGSISTWADTDNVIQKLPSLDVRGLVPDEVRLAPGAASILTDEEIETFRPFTLHDAFDFIPGVRTIDDDVLGRRSGIGVRGAPPRRSRKTLLMEDGTPINASTYLDSSSHYTPPADRLEQIEVLKGAGQLVHGPLNNHGIINFRNMRATLTPETTAEIAGGNLDTIKRHFSHTRTEGPVGLVFSYTGINSDGTFDTEEHQFDDFYVSADWDINSRHNLKTSFTYFRERSDGYDENNLSLAEFQSNPRSKLVLDEGREFNNISVDYLKGDITHDFFVTNDLTVSTRLFITDLDRPRFRTRGTAPTNGGVMEGRDRLYRTHGAETRVEWANLKALGLDHTIQSGIRYERHLFDDKRPVGRPGEALDIDNRGNIFAVAGQDGFTRDGRLITYQATAVSVFLQDTMRYGNWTVTPGIRVENYSQKKSTKFRPGGDLGRETDYNTLLLPGISFLYDGFQDAQVYTGVHRGFAPAIARSEDFPLVPETGINSQIGVRGNISTGINYDIAGFYNLIQDTLIRDGIDGFGDGLFINAIDSDIYGVDIGLRADSSPYTGSPYNFFGQLAYNYTNAEFDNGNRVPEVADHSASFTFGLEHTQGWHISGTVSHLGSFFSDLENSVPIAADGESGKVPSRTLLSARASYTLGGTLMDKPGDVTFWVQGRNLTDKLYISDVQDGIRPGAERTIIGGVTVKF